MEDFLPDKGLHHITALAGDPQQNVDFYQQTLGLRLIKKTVNFDQPQTYHLYYSNQQGAVGSNITFFPYTNATQGKQGSGEAYTISFSIPANSEDFWSEHLSQKSVEFEGPFDRFNTRVIRFRDPDDLALELVAHEEADDQDTWEKGPIPAEHAIRGVWGTVLRLEDGRATGELLESLLGFTRTQQQESLQLYQTGSPTGNSLIIKKARKQSGKNGRGIIHHIAFRSNSKKESEELREKLQNRRLHPSPIIDRYFFESIYFPTPDGVLFEIATDKPGFDRDPIPDQPGNSLFLPPWLESRREQIKERLPQLETKY
jgi:glyoxalase family protein